MTPPDISFSTSHNDASSDASPMHPADTVYSIDETNVDGTVLFDHNNDGIKTGTGWIAPDDGLLVLDRNGLIDNGNELFGDNTLKSDGTLAVNGFDALADLDSNGDGVIDADDAQFHNLRVWRDLNSEGISQGNELKTLSATGIVAIHLENQLQILDVGNGNVTNAVGTFERSDGSESTIQSAASLDLAANNFYREFTDTIEIPPELKGLPDMRGSGSVRDFPEADWYQI